jgi:hypothetical protein
VTEHRLVRIDPDSFDHAGWECSCGKTGRVTRERSSVGQYEDGDEAAVIAVKRHQVHARLHRRWGT